MNERLYDLYYTDDQGRPTDKVGGKRWEPMTHQQAITARSKFRKPSDLTLVEIRERTKE